MHCFLGTWYIDGFGYGKWALSGVIKAIGFLYLHGELIGDCMIVVVLCCKGNVVGGYIGLTILPDRSISKRLIFLQS